MAKKLVAYFSASGIPPEVARGMIFCPWNLYCSRNVLIIVGATYHQIGKAMKCRSIYNNLLDFVDIDDTVEGCHSPSLGNASQYIPVVLDMVPCVHVQKTDEFYAQAETEEITLTDKPRIPVQTIARPFQCKNCHRAVLVIDHILNTQGMVAQLRRDYAAWKC